MSQVMAPERPGEIDDISDAFDYKPVPILAPVALFFGITSLLSLLTVIGLVVCVVGIVIGGLALWSIKRGDGAYRGHAIAMTGLALSAFFLVAGSASHIYAYNTEVPDGHYRVNFSRDISDKQFVNTNGRQNLHPDVAPYEGQLIFIKGYMYNTRTTKGLSGFTLLKDNGKCCFGGNPKSYDMMEIRLQDGLTVDKIDGLVSVAGRLVCKPISVEGAVVYIVEATQCERARTSF